MNYFIKLTTVVTITTTTIPINQDVENVISINFIYTYLKISK